MNVTSGLYRCSGCRLSAANYSPSESANLSTLFDVGGAVGGILAGFLNDWTGAPGIVCVLLLLVAIPMVSVPVRAGHMCCAYWGDTSPAQRSPQACQISSRRALV